jgi:hypothetical protein
MADDRQINITIAGKNASEPAFREATERIRGLGDRLRETEAPATALSTRMVAIGTAAGSAIGTIAVGALQNFGAAMVNAAKDGVQLGTLVSSFDRLAKGIGQTGDAMLGVTRGATKGLISDLNIMQSANKAMLLGLPVTSAEMGKLAQTAVILGKAMGQDATKSLDDLIVALGRSSPMILDNLGLTVKVGEANEKYAASIGKSADALTDAEKKTAFYRAAMEAAEQKTQQLGGVQLTLSDNVDRITTGVGNMITSWSRQITQSSEIEGFFERVANKVTALAVEMEIAAEAARRFEDENKKLSKSEFAPTSIGAGKERDDLELARRQVRLRELEGEVSLGNVRALVAAGNGDAGARMLEVRRLLGDKSSAGFLRLPKIDPADLNELEAKLTKGPREAVKVWEEEKKKFEAFTREVVKFGEEQFRQLMAVTSVIPQFGNLPGALSQENRFGPFAFAGAFNPRGDISQVGPGALPESMLRENMLLKNTPFASSAFAPGRLPSFASMMQQQLSQTIMQALTGGGNVAGSIGGSLTGSIFGKLSGGFDNDSGLFTGGLGKMLQGGLGKTLGGALGSVIPGVGTLLGGLAGGLFGKLFGPSEREKTDKARGSFTDMFGSEGELRRQAEEAGVSLDKLFSTKRVKDFEKEAANVAKQLAQFADTQAADTERLNAAVEKYGFTFEQLGPKFRQQKLHEQAEELIQDWRVLIQSGFEVDVVNKQMADSMNDYIKKARQTGAEVPEALRPILQKMVDQRLLLNENGDAFEDLESVGLNFSKNTVKAIDDLILTIKDLILKLDDAAKPRTGSVTINQHTNYTESGTPPGAGNGDRDDSERPTRHQGGRILPWSRAHGGRFLGPREVPIIAEEGEYVISRRGVDAFGVGGLDMINAGMRVGGGQPISITVHVDARGATEGAAGEIERVLDTWARTKLRPILQDGLNTGLLTVPRRQVRGR